jgi:TolB protein
MMKQALRVAFSFLMLWAAVLHAEVRIEITQGVDSARPIGVVPFQWAGPGAAPEDIGGIVAADLRNSGKFNPLDRSRLPQQPGSAQEVQPAAWSALGIDAVVVGQVTLTRTALQRGLAAGGYRRCTGYRSGTELLQGH